MFFFLYKLDNQQPKEHKMHKNGLMKSMLNLGLSEVELYNRLKKCIHIDYLGKDIKKL